jgi:hypothetical protein
MSEFIEKSKHAEMTAAVTSHFGTAKHRAGPQEASGKGFPLYGSAKWNTPEIGSQDFYNGESGTNYTPRNKAGHHTK